MLRFFSVYLIVSALTAFGAVQPSSSPVASTSPKNTPTPSIPSIQPPGESSAAGTASAAKKPEQGLVIRVATDQQKGDGEKGWAGWTRFLLNLFFPWPVLILSVLLYLRFSKKAMTQLRDFLSLFKSIKFLGNEFVLSTEAGRDAEYAIRLFRKEVRQKLDELTTKHGIAEKHRKLIDQVFPNAQALNMRSTIHVPDMLFESTLYQLIEYYPESDTHRGRIFSIRYGIIGKAWRSEKAQWALDLKRTQDNLVNEWGMTKAEAAKAVGDKKSYASLILNDLNGEKAAIIYIESPDRGVFGDEKKQKEIEEQMAKTASDVQLMGALDAIKKEIIAGPRIEIFDTAQMGHK
jgi:hypothetical protein